MLCLTLRECSEIPLAEMREQMFRAIEQAQLGIERIDPRPKLRQQRWSHWPQASLSLGTIGSGQISLCGCSRRGHRLNDERVWRDGSMTLPRMADLRQPCNMRLQQTHRIQPRLSACGARCRYARDTRQWLACHATVAKVQVPFNPDCP
jgi:hypothetical protein